jgi:hypothetical protein
MLSPSNCFAATLSRHRNLYRASVREALRIRHALLSTRATPAKTDEQGNRAHHREATACAATMLQSLRTVSGVSAKAPQYLRRAAQRPKTRALATTFMVSSECERWFQGDEALISGSVRAFDRMLV